MAGTAGGAGARGVVEACAGSTWRTGAAATLSYDGSSNPPPPSARLRRSPRHRALHARQPSARPHGKQSHEQDPSSDEQHQRGGPKRGESRGVWGTMARGTARLMPPPALRAPRRSRRRPACVRMDVQRRLPRMQHLDGLQVAAQQCGEQRAAFAVVGGPPVGSHAQERAHDAHMPVRRRIRQRAPAVLMSAHVQLGLEWKPRVEQPVQVATRCGRHERCDALVAQSVDVTRSPRVCQPRGVHEPVSRLRRALQPPLWGCQLLQVNVGLGSRWHREAVASPVQKQRERCGHRAPATGTTVTGLSVP